MLQVLRFSPKLCWFCILEAICNFYDIWLLQNI